MSFDKLLVFSKESLLHDDLSNCCFYKQLFHLIGRLILRYNSVSHSYLKNVALSHLILLTCCHHEVEISFMWLRAEVLVFVLWVYL